MEHKSDQLVPARYPTALDWPRPPSAPENPDDAVNLVEYLNTVRARRWTVVAVALTVVIVTMIATLKQTPIYSVSATIEIDRENPNVLNFKDVYEVSATDDALQTQYQILYSHTLARRVIEELHLDKSPELKAESPGLLGSMMDRVRDYFPMFFGPADPDSMNHLVDVYLSRLDVAPVRQARLVKISFEGRDPQLITNIINTHARDFYQQNLESKFDATQEASDFLSQELVGLKSNLEKAEDKVQEYSRANQILITADGQNTAIEKLQQLEQEFTKAQADRFQKQANYSLITSGKSDALSQVMTSQTVAALTARLSELKREDSEIGVTFAPDYPRRQRLASQIAELKSAIDGEKNKIVESVSAEYAAAAQRSDLLEKAVSDQRVVVNQLNQQIIQYNILKREADSEKQVYEGLQTRLKEARVSAGLHASNIRIVDKGEVPERPARPKKALNLLISLMTGLVLGVGAAFFQEYLDNSVKTPEEITRLLKIPTLGVIPRYSTASGAIAYGYGASARPLKPGSTDGPKPSMETVSFDSSSSSLAEAYRSMRTSLLLSSRDHPPKSIVVTSSLPSEGKTVTAVNTAISLTQSGARVVLVDADMRKPRLHTIFALEGKPGLSSLLAGAANLKDVVYPAHMTNLFVIPCGVIPPNPGELLLSERFHSMVQALGEYFDYVVIDTPPTSNVSDARILASSVQGLIFVIKAFSTSHEVVKQALTQLKESHANILGAVLNDVDIDGRRGYYPYYTGYQSSYSGYHSAERPKN